MLNSTTAGCQRDQSAAERSWSGGIFRPNVVRSDRSICDLGENKEKDDLVERPTITILASFSSFYQRRSFSFSVLAHLPLVVLAYNCKVSFFLFVYLRLRFHWLDLFSIFTYCQPLTYLRDFSWQGAERWVISPQSQIAVFFLSVTMTGTSHPSKI